MAEVMRKMQFLTQKFLWTERAPLPLPWFYILLRKHPISLIYRTVFSNEWHSHGLGRIHLIARTIAYPLVSNIQVLLMLRKWGTKVKRSLGVGLLRQFRQLFVLATFLNIPPDDYYKFRLFEKNVPSEVKGFLGEKIKAQLLSRLNDQLDCLDLNDKVRFHHRCTTANLPVIPIIAVINKGKHLDSTIDRRGFPKVDLFMKKSRSSHGAGAELWCYIAGDGGWKNGQLILSDAQLQEHFRDQSLDCLVIVQPRLINHPELQTLSLIGLCSVRIVTHCYPEGDPSILLAALRMPQGLSHVDNCSAGGIAASISLDTGRLSNAVSMTVGSPVIARHPDTGTAITGFQVPFWSKVVEVALRGHRNFGEFAFLGWDIAITAEGPVIVECNTNWGAWIAQVPQGRYLGDTQFVDCYMKHLAHLN